jgi:hypothetical protein
MACAVCRMDRMAYDATLPLVALAVFRWGDPPSGSTRHTPKSQRLTLRPLRDPEPTHNSLEAVRPLVSQRRNVAVLRRGEPFQERLARVDDKVANLHGRAWACTGGTSEVCS